MKKKFFTKVLLIWGILAISLPINTHATEIVYKTEPIQKVNVERSFSKDLEKAQNSLPCKNLLVIDEMFTANSEILKNDEIEKSKESLKSLIDQYESEKEALEEVKKLEEEQAKSLVKNTVNLTSEVDTSSVWSIANSLVGTGGDCFYIVKLFNYYYKGGWTGIAYQTWDPEPGDVIFYADGSLGTTHWATYLGGDQALQGNWNGTTIIGNVYINGASDPIFYKTN